MKKALGKIYQFCADCDKCPIAIETKIEKDSGLEIKDDFGGSIRLTNQNLKELKSFLETRFKN